LQQHENDDGHNTAAELKDAAPNPADSEDTDGLASSLRGEDADVESLGRVVTLALRNLALDQTKSIPITPQKTSDGSTLIHWYTTDDPENPKNWSSLKKSFVMFALCIYTFTVYSVGPTYFIAGEQIEPYFGVSAVAASLGLGLYVLANGIGDPLFAPLRETQSSATIQSTGPVHHLLDSFLL
jgi:DHA1 family multidrug resistance protein-like MFS transporter